MSSSFLIVKANILSEKKNVQFVRHNCTMKLVKTRQGEHTQVPLPFSLPIAEDACYHANNDSHSHWDEDGNNQSHG